MILVVIGVVNFVFLLSRMAKVDFKGDCQMAEVRQIKSTTKVTFKVDHMMDRIEALEHRPTYPSKMDINSPVYEIKYLKKANSREEFGTFKFRISLSCLKKKLKTEPADSRREVEHIGIYLNPVDLEEDEQITIKMRVRPGYFFDSSFVFTFREPDQSFGWPTMYSKNELKSHLDQDGALVLNSWVTVLVDAEVKDVFIQELPREPFACTLDMDLNVNNCLCDFTIISADGHKIFCSKAILAARSPVFKHMLESTHFKETTESQIEIKDFKAKTLKCFWYYCLSDSIDITYSSRLKSQEMKTEQKKGRKAKDALHVYQETSHLNILQNLLILADKYDVPGLAEEAADCLMYRVRNNMEKALETLQIAAQVQAQTLVRHILDLILKNRDNQLFSIDKIREYDLPKEVYERVIKHFW